MNTILAGSFCLALAGSGAACFTAAKPGPIMYCSDSQMPGVEIPTCREMLDQARRNGNSTGSFTVRPQ
jgi:hypothetical protein